MLEILLPAALILATLTAFFIRPFFGLCVLCAASLLETPSLHYVPSSFFSVQMLPVIPVSLLVLVGFAANAVLFRRELRPRDPFFPVLCFIVLYHGLSLVWAPDLVFGLWHQVNLMFNVLLYYLVVRLTDTRRRLRTVYGVVVGVILFNVAWMVIAYFWDLYTKFTFSSRFFLLFETFATEGGPRLGGLCSVNQAGGSLAFAAMLAMGLSFTTKRRGLRRLLFGGSLAMFALITLSGSRAAMLGAFCGLMLLFFLHPVARASYFKYAALTTLFFILSVFALNPGFVDKILMGFGFPAVFGVAAEKSTTLAMRSVGAGIRVEYWRLALAAMLEHPLTLVFGLGPGGFTFHSHEIQVNSIYLAFFYDMGLVGVLTGGYLAGLFVKTVRETFRVATDPDMRTLALFAVCAFTAEVGVHGLLEFDMTSVVSRWMFYFPALTVACLRLAREETPEIRHESGASRPTRSL